MLLLLLHLLFAFPQVQPSEESWPIMIETVVIHDQKNQNNILYVTVGNQTTMALESLGVSLDTTSGTKPIDMATALNSHQWRTSSVELPQRIDDEAVLRVKYTIAGINSEVTKPVQLSRTTPDARPDSLPVILPALLGILGVLSGSAVTAYFTARREAKQANLEWSKLLFQTYQSEYRLFCQRVSGTVALALISRHFDDLQNTAIVPPKMHSLMEQLRLNLTNPTKKPPQVARDEFLERFLVLITNAGGKDI